MSAANKLVFLLLLAAGNIAQGQPVPAAWIKPLPPEAEKYAEIFRIKDSSAVRKYIGTLLTEPENLGNTVDLLAAVAWDHKALPGPLKKYPAAAAVNLLGQINSPKSEEALQRLLASGDKETGRAAINALSNFSNAATISALTAILGSDSPDLRGAAEGSLIAIGTAAVPVMLGSAAGSKAPALLWVIKVLGITGDKRALPFLTEKLRDRDAQIREKAAQAMGRIGEPSTYDSVAALLDDSGVHVRAKALQALYRIDRKKSFLPALRAAKDKSPIVRVYAIETLGLRQDDESAEAVIAALADSSAQVRDSAAAALGKMPGEKTAAALRKFRQGTPAAVPGAPAESGPCGDSGVDVGVVIKNYSGDAKHMPEQHLWDALKDYGICRALAGGSIAACGELGGIHPALRQDCEQIALSYMILYSTMTADRERFSQLCVQSAALAGIAKQEHRKKLRENSCDSLVAALPCGSAPETARCRANKELTSFIIAAREHQGADWRLTAVYSRQDASCDKLARGILEIYCQRN